jgi:hypothetical protein
VTEITGFDDIALAMIDTSNIKGMDINREDLRRAVNQQFNEEGLREQFAQVFYIFPGKEVKAGDTWQKSYDVKGKMPGTYNTIYKVKGIEGDFVRLDAKTTITSDMGQVNIGGDQTGIFLVDSRTGLVVNAEIAQDIKITTPAMSTVMKGKGKITGTAR